MEEKTIHVDRVGAKQLPGRVVRVLSEALPVKNLTFGVCDVPAKSEMLPHSHEQEEVIFILEGYGHVTIDGKEEKVQPGTFVHFASGVEHFTANESDRFMRFVFSFSPPVIVGSYDKRP
jgi:quercetin dioxygenase-like cupin family protein